MGSRNVSDLQLWWSHPIYVPPAPDRVRGKGIDFLYDDATSEGDIIRMDSSFPDIDDLTLPSFIGQSFRTKEHMGIGQTRVRRSYVNVADVKEASGTFTCNFGANDTPEQFFAAVQADPGLGGDGRKRPMRMYGVISERKGLNSHFFGTATMNGAFTEGATSISIDAVLHSAWVKNDHFRLAGDSTIYRTSSRIAHLGSGSIAITPALSKDFADNTVLTKVFPNRATLVGNHAQGVSSVRFNGVMGDGFEAGDFFTLPRTTTPSNADPTNYEILTVIGNGAAGGSGRFIITPTLQVATDGGTAISKSDFEPNLDTWVEANVCDFIISEFDYTPEIDGELMGTYTLQAAGTGFEYVRNPAA